MVVVSHLVLGAVGMTVHFKEQLMTVTAQELALALRRQIIAVLTRFVLVVVVCPAVIAITAPGVVMEIVKFNGIDIDAMEPDLVATTQEHKQAIVVLT